MENSYTRGNNNFDIFLCMRNGHTTKTSPRHFVKYVVVVVVHKININELYTSTTKKICTAITSLATSYLTQKTTPTKYLLDFFS